MVSFYFLIFVRLLSDPFALVPREECDEVIFKISTVFLSQLQVFKIEKIIDLLVTLAYSHGRICWRQNCNNKLDFHGNS